jgi:hypothetical protein
MKKTILFLGFILVPFMAQALEASIDMDPLNLSAIQETQDNYFTQEGSYKQEKLDNSKQIFVYETPKGEWGYQIVIEDEYYLSSIGYGVEADERTYVVDKEQRRLDKINEEQLK